MTSHRRLGFACFLITLTLSTDAPAVLDCAGGFGRVLRSPDAGDAGGGGGGSDDASGRKGTGRKKHEKFGWGEKPSERVFNLKADDPLTRLGLKPGASAAEIRQAWRDGTRLYHPDQDPKASAEVKAELTAKFNRITDAYETLTGKSKKTRATENSGAAADVNRGAYFNGTNKKFADEIFGWGDFNIASHDVARKAAFLALVKRLSPLLAGKQNFKDAFLTTVEAMPQLKTDRDLSALSASYLDSLLGTLGKDFKEEDLTSDDLRRMAKHAGDAFPRADELAFRKDASKAKDKFGYADAYAERVLSHQFFKEAAGPEVVQRYAKITQDLYGGNERDFYLNLITSSKWASLDADQRRQAANLVLRSNLASADKVKVLEDAAQKLAPSNPAAAEAYRRTILVHLEGFESRQTDLKSNHPELWERVRGLLKHPDDPVVIATIDKFLTDFPTGSGKLADERRDFATRVANRLRKEMTDRGNLKDGYLDEVEGAVGDFGNRAKRSFVEDFFPLFEAQNPSSEQYEKLDAVLHRVVSPESEIMRIADRAFRASLATARDIDEYVTRYRTGNSYNDFNDNRAQRRDRDPAALVADISQKYSLPPFEVYGKFVRGADLRTAKGRTQIDDLIAFAGEKSLSRAQKRALYGRLVEQSKRLENAEAIRLFEAQYAKYSE